MARFIVDHLNNTIHQTRYINDRCGHKAIPADLREDLQNEEEIELFLKNTYNYCHYCNDTFAISEIQSTMENSG
ncbi:MAG: hypothetical protein K6T88_11910 [Bacillus sp. (in: Bacteria)]|nr:hypothetical protein [Bacillus sp. (in: firmicutes)]